MAAPTSAIEILKDSYKEWSGHNATRLAAAIAFGLSASAHAAGGAHGFGEGPPSKTGTTSGYNGTVGSVGTKKSTLGEQKSAPPAAVSSGNGSGRSCPHGWNGHSCY